MALVATGAAVSGPHGPLLLPTSLVAEPGEVTLVMADPGPSSTALALVLGGRLALDGGEVHLGHDGAPGVRRQKVALVDVPGITEPDGGLPVDVVVGEELALAGLPSRTADIDAVLREHDLADRANARWEQLDPVVKTRLLTFSAAARRGIEALVVVGPDRRGGDPHGWYAVAREHAEAGAIVVVLATHASTRLLGLDADEHTFEVGVA